MDYKKGFSIIEMIVAVAIFALVIGSVMGLFISAIHAQRKFLATQKLLDETSYIMEYMSRSLRMAKRDNTGNCILQFSSCDPAPGRTYGYPTGYASWWVRFLDYQNRCRQFGFAQGWVSGYPIQRIVEWVADPGFTAGEICTDFDPWIGPYDNYLTSENLTIPTFGPNFIFKGELGTDYLQPRVTVNFELAEMSKYVGGVPLYGPRILIQTTISQRNLDI